MCYGLNILAETDFSLFYRAKLWLTVSLTTSWFALHQPTKPRHHQIRDTTSRPLAVRSYHPVDVPHLARQTDHGRSHQNFQLGPQIQSSPLFSHFQHQKLGTVNLRNPGSTQEKLTRSRRTCYSASLRTLNNSITPVPLQSPARQHSVNARHASPADPVPLPHRSISQPQYQSHRTRRYR